MTAVLHIGDPVVTGDLLAREHKGERAVSVVPDAILTPTAWDYIRQHRLQLARGQVSAPAAEVAEEEAAKAEGKLLQPIAELSLIHI